MELNGLLERMKMDHLLNALDGVCEQAAQGDLDYKGFLTSALEAEWRGRYQRGVEGRLKQARLPWVKTLDQFEFDFQPSIDRKAVRELAGCSFIERAHNVALLGPPGVGKTHLAVALAVKAVEAGFSALFLTLETLMVRLIRARHENRLERCLQQLSYPRLLVLDELGYLPLSREEASLFFRLLVRRYERGTGMSQDIDASTSGGQYDFLMREQNPVQGRWWTPDPSGMAAVDPTNPQSWNRYAYVGGTPLSSVDPLGLRPDIPPAGPDFGTPCTVNGIDAWCGSDGGGIDTTGGGFFACPVADCFGVTGVMGAGDTTVFQTWSGFEFSQWGLDTGSIDSAKIFDGVSGTWIPVSTTVTPFPTSNTNGCGPDLGCDFFVGFVNTFINGNPSGIFQLAGSEIVGAGGAAVAVAPEAAIEGLGAVGNALAQVPTLGDAAYSYLLSNPQLSIDFANALTPWPSFTLSVGGISGAVVSNWDRLTNWVEGN